MARNPKAQYDIEAKDNTKKGTQNAAGGLKKLGTTAKASFKKIGIAAGVATGAAVAAYAAMNKLTSIYGKQEDAIIKIAAASKNNVNINKQQVEGLIDLASSLQSVSTYGDEALIPLMTLGVNMGYTSEQIEGVSKAAINLAAATDMSLDSAFKNVYKTLGGVRGELGETLPAMRDLTEEQLKSGAAIDIINEKYAGMAEAARSGVEGSKEAFKNMIGDQLEKIGSALAPLQKTLYDTLTPVFEDIGNWFEKNGDAITNFFLNFGEIARLVFSKIGESLSAAFAWDNVLITAKALFKSIMSSFGRMVYWLLTVVGSIGTSIWEPLKKGFEWVGYGIKVAWQGMINKLSEGIKWFVENPVDSIVVAFKTVVNKIGEAIEWILNGLIGMINKIVEGLNKVLEGAHNAAQALRHPFREEKREEWGGGIGTVNKMDIGWLDPKKHQQLTTNLDKFTGDIDKIEKPGDFSEVWDTIKESWKQTGAEGVDHLSAVMDSFKGLGSTLAEPWKIGFEGLGVEFFDILAREIPEKTKSAVDKILDGLDADSSTDEINKAFKGMYNALIKPLTPLQAALYKLKRGVQDVGEVMWDVGKKIGGAIGEVAIAGLIQLGSWLWNTVTSLEGFQDIMDTLTEGINTIFTSLVQPLFTAATPLIDAILQVVSALATALTPVVLSLASVMNTLIPSIQSIASVASLLGSVISILAPIFELVADLLNQILVPVIEILTTTLNIVGGIFEALIPVITTLLNIVLDVLTPALEFVSGVVTALVPIFTIIGDIITALNPLFIALGELLNSLLIPLMVSLSSIIEGILFPVMLVLADVLMILTPLFELVGSILKVLNPLFAVLANVAGIVAVPLQLLGVILTLLTPIFFALGEIIGWLVPVFEFLGLAIDAITRPIEFVADLFDWLGQGLQALGDLLYYIVTFQWDKAGTVQWPTAFTTDAFTRPLGQSSSPTPDLTDTLTFDDTTIPTTTANDVPLGRAASYGGNEIHLNVTINTEAVVGEPGLREFALMINDEITRAKKLGVA